MNKYIWDNKIENFYDIFCGGANVASNIVCENVYANDLSPTLIALHRAAQEDFSQIIPNETREEWDLCYGEYKRLQALDFNDEPALPLYRIGAEEWLASFSGRGFPGGYGVKDKDRSLYMTRYRNLETQSKTEGYKKIQFTCSDYRQVEIKSNSIIYVDPPYKGTKKYGINKNFPFNYEEYYEWLREAAKTTPIFISEEDMPDDFIEVWHKPVARGVDASSENRKVATERLYFIDKRGE